MKKLLFLFALNLVYIFCDEEMQSTKCISIEDPKVKTDCQSVNYDSKLKCCFVTYQISSIPFSRCVPIYDNSDSINQYKSMMHKVKKLKILCSSNFIKLNILVLILALIF